MPTKLTKLVIDRVDLVDAGANPEARIVLFKRKEPAVKNFDPTDAWLRKVRARERAGVTPVRVSKAADVNAELEAAAARAAGYTSANAVPRPELPGVVTKFLADPAGKKLYARYVAAAEAEAEAFAKRYETEGIQRPALR